MMKTLLLFLGWSLISVSSVLAGGNSSTVEIDQVKEIIIQEGKIILKGHALVRFRVMSTEEKGDHQCWGQPAQWVHARTKDGVFVILPYFGHPEISSLNGDVSKEFSDEVWLGVMKKAKALKKGDPVTISFQGNRITLDGLDVKKVEGFGTLQPLKK